MDASIKDEIASAIINYMDGMINHADIPQIPRQFTENPAFIQLHEKILAIREVLSTFVTGDLSKPISATGYLADSCKSLQTNLRYLIWKIQQIETGDYNHRIDFMGDFSKTFNSMAEKLAANAKTSRRKEEDLVNLALSLQKEMRLNDEKRNAVLEELRKRESEFKYHAQHDSLTGILNRRSFLDQALAKLQSAKAAGVSCCICMLDIDHFKKLNDTYGHVLGDEALRHVVQQSMKRLRQSESDIIGRYGGEEFVFFFYGTDAQQGAMIAEHIRILLAESKFKLSAGKDLTITASFGVCAIPEGWHDAYDIELLMHMIEAADQAMYAAKAKGRNRVCVAPTKVDMVDNFPDILPPPMTK